MHRLAAQPGGWTPDTDGVVIVEQTPAPLIVLTAADTDIQAIAAALPKLPSDFPAMRVCNLLNLQQALSIDEYCDSVLSQANAVLLRLLGGQSYWPYGLEQLKSLRDTNPSLILVVMPGDDRPDPTLMHHSSVSLTEVHSLWQYFAQGGIDNIRHSLLRLSDIALETTYHPPAAQTVPKVGVYGISPNQHSDA